MKHTRLLLTHSDFFPFILQSEKHTRRATWTWSHHNESHLTLSLAKALFLSLYLCPYILPFRLNLFSFLFFVSPFCVCVHFYRDNEFTNHRLLLIFSPGSSWLVSFSLAQTRKITWLTWRAEWNLLSNQSNRFKGIQMRNNAQSSIRIHNHEDEEVCFIYLQRDRCRDGGKKNDTSRNTLILNTGYHSSCYLENW